jgi:hypothetical protein
MRRIPLAFAAAMFAVILAGCGPVVATPTPSPSASSEPEASPSPTPTPEAGGFTAPTSCTELLGADLEADILATGVVLFSSTDGTGIYAPIASTQDGGDPFSCWYGKDGVDLSSFEFAAQPITSTDEHEGIVAVLGAAGFASSTDGDVVTFVQTGDEGTTPAIVHVVRPDSWFTVFSAFGGADRLAVMQGYLDRMVEHLTS